MAYTLIDNLIGGVDRTRPRYAGQAGTIWSGINGHITRGGDFEKRKSFVSHKTLPTGQTFGLARSASNVLTVFGSDASGSVSMPAGVNYVQLQHPTSPAQPMASVESVDLFAGLFYVIAKYANGDYRHFYDGVSVGDWGSGGTKPSGFGTIARTHKRKMYSPIGALLWFSKVDTANSFDTSQSGSGFVNVNNHQSGSDTVTALGTYQSQLAIFSRRVVQLWNMEDDDAENAPAQYLYETGTRSPRSVVGFGDLDAFYLSDSGIRSLRARSGTNIAGINDVGTAVDTLVAEYLATLTEAQIARAVAIVEPIDGRYWLAVGERIFVFSYFPSKKVSAWTWYEPELAITEFTTVQDRVYARAGDVIYLYGGSDNATYDSCEVTLALPFLSAGKPGTFKQWHGIDIAAQGEWNVKLLVNPNDEDEFVDVGDVEDHTFQGPNAGLGVHSPLIAPVLLNEAAGSASVSQIALHNDAAEPSV